MQRSIQQLVAVFILLTAIAWWITGRVAISNSLRDFFLGEEESSTQTEASPGDQEEALIDKALTDLPPPPSNHSPEVAGLLSRLKEIEDIPAILVNAVKRDHDTPKDQTPTPWSEAELEALKNYQAKFREAWEPFLSGPQPDWEHFPDSALLFRSSGLFLINDYHDNFEHALHEPGQPSTQENSTEFLIRLIRQTTTLGTLRFGGLSGWGISDSVSLVRALAHEILRKSQYCFPPESENPELLLRWAPSPPTIQTLRNGLKTDHAVFLRAAEYLESLPGHIPPSMALTHLLGDKGDAEWFFSHLENPTSTRDLASAIRLGAEQISLLEQKTYLSGPAWRQWTTGNPEGGLCLALRGSLDGMKKFETTQMEYQVALAFLKASAAYRATGIEGMRTIPDPAKPGSFLAVTNSTNGITISSAYQEETGKNSSFSFKPETAP
jgi:hypothetical protein